MQTSLHTVQYSGQPSVSISPYPTPHSPRRPDQTTPTVSQSPGNHVSNSEKKIGWLFLVLQYGRLTDSTVYVRTCRQAGRLRTCIGSIASVTECSKNWAEATMLELTQLPLQLPPRPAAGSPLHGHGSAVSGGCGQPRHRRNHMRSPSTVLSAHLRTRPRFPSLVPARATGLRDKTAVSLASSPSGASEFFVPAWASS